ncbi:unnamed protein product [Soboliphyme baturini]|uniref:Peptidase M1 membrane alanine aminopeptidase domain-containing protein n=1 Tax=Soboliphyme baturini TaxID=241478 RepID=A0A3P8GHS5_9BILA|nr:unnamed protein product [Soboliphyme baturini]
MQSTFARKAFPCWDEPALKATFDVTLVVPEDLVALANSAEEVVTRLENGWKEVKFLPTCQMSTYLVAFVIGDLAYVEGHTDDGIQIRVYADPSKVDQGRYALEVAQKGLKFYGEYFGIKYQLSKCDLVAIPDFAMGAMENWGLITYREVRLLLDETKSSSSVKEDIANTEWWTDLWLNEGFATWLSHHFVNIAYPEFDTWTQFVNLETARAMKLDSLHSSHPIEVTINDPEEVETIFDVVSYSKSASIIRMLHDYLGDKLFRKGLQTYLKKFQFQNARTADFWQCLSDASGRDVAALMSNWTKWMGYPVVQVSMTHVESENPLKLEQRRFLDDGSIEVPFYVQLNYGFTGFYRVQYSEPMLNSLLKAVRHEQLSAVDRLNICNDIFALARAGIIPAVTYFNALKSYKDETDYTVWADIDQGIDVVWNCLERTPYLNNFKSFCRSLYKHIAAKLGSEPIAGECKYTTVHIFCLLSDAACLTNVEV